MYTLGFQPFLAHPSLKGISEITGSSMHLVVAYNTFLDILSGCVSGAVQAREGTAPSRMLHFRGLDWYMPQLLPLLITVSYVRGGSVVARAVTYAGYVGCLTGVRSGLSISLNYRARMTTSWSSRLALIGHNLLVLLGLRRSISSLLRTYLLSEESPPSLADIAKELSSCRTSPCYLTFASPTQVLVVEKDLKTSRLQFSNDFLAVTNHDLEIEQWGEEHYRAAFPHENDVGPSLTLSGPRDIMGDSIARKTCITTLYTTQVARRTRRSAVTLEDIKGWLGTSPVLNDQTNFSCIMDPSSEGGGLAWVEAYEEREEPGYIDVSDDSDMGSESA